MMKVLKWKLQSVLWDLVVQSFLLCIDLCLYWHYWVFLIAFSVQHTLGILHSI